jgi:multicomponent K+:H+ antiporter subunit A
LLIAGTALAAAALPLVIGGWTQGGTSITPIDPLFVLLWIIGGACAFGAAVQAKFHRLAALIMVGGAGLITCLTFAWFSAPDLALTQIAVETVTLVLILLGLRWLPRRLASLNPRIRTARARARRGRDATLAMLFGVGLAMLAYSVLTRPQVSELSSFFIRNALEKAGGRNVVNVILVDFRGFDTLGEITVVGIVAMIVYALLRRFRPAPESVEVPKAQRRASGAEPDIASPDEPLPRGDLRIPAVLARLLLPIAGLVSLYFLLRGHHAPGGGFVAGLVMATAVIVQYIVGGTIWVESRLTVHPLSLIGVGLLAAAVAGIGAWWGSLAFLTARSVTIPVPLIGDIHLSSTLLFDLGVYLVVIGATLLMLVALAHQTLRSPRKTVTQSSADIDDNGPDSIAEAH